MCKNILQGSLLPVAISTASPSASMLDIYFGERCLSPTFLGRSSQGVAEGRNEEIYHPVPPEPHVAVSLPTTAKEQKPQS